MIPFYIFLTIILFFGFQGYWTVVGYKYYNSDANGCDQHGEGLLDDYINSRFMQYDSAYYWNNMMWEELFAGTFMMVVTGCLLLCCVPLVIVSIQRGAPNRGMYEDEESRQNRLSRLVDSLNRSNYNPRQHIYDDTCSICLVPYDQESKITVLPCNDKHYFHTECLEQWIR